MSNPQNLSAKKRKYREDKLLWEAGKGSKPEYREKYEKILPLSFIKTKIRGNKAKIHRNENFELFI